MSLLALVVTIVSSVVLNGFISNPGYLVVLGQTNQVNSSAKNTVNLHGIETKKVHVGDIDIAYKMFGKGNPILLINGFSAPLDFWDPMLLEKLASNHTVIVFDNRGIGNTTSGDKKFAITQFANDTSGLLDALKIKKADVIGWSMGGMVAQELALFHPDKVGKLTIYASTCGGNETRPPSPEAMKVFANQSGTSQERLQKFLPILFLEQWRTKYPNYYQNLQQLQRLFPIEL